MISTLVLVAAAGLCALGILIYLAIHYTVAEGGDPPEEPDQTRRGFLLGLLMASLLVLLGEGWSVAYRLLTSLTKEARLEPVLIGRVDEFRPGSFVFFRRPVNPDMTPGDHPCVLIVGEGGELSAYSAVCTHLGCILQPSDEGLYCPCHAGLFDLEGRPVSGPPTKPLPRVRLRVEETGEVYAVGWEGGS